MMVVVVMVMMMVVLHLPSLPSSVPGGRGCCSRRSGRQVTAANPGWPATAGAAAVMVAVPGVRLQAGRGRRHGEAGSGRRRRGKERPPAKSTTS